MTTFTTEREAVARAIWDATHEYGWNSGAGPSSIEIERMFNAADAALAASLKWRQGTDQAYNDLKAELLRERAAKINAEAMERRAAETERAACELIARDGSFPFDIDVWLNSTKKEMTALIALAIADAIAARATASQTPP